MIQKGHTLEELENQMLQRPPPTITRPVTAEELERAMRGEVPPPQMHQPPRPNVPPQYRGVPQMPMQVSSFVTYTCIVKRHNNLKITFYLFFVIFYMMPLNINQATTT